jgi:hypothetical protein
VGSSPDDVFFFVLFPPPPNLPNPSSCTMALGSTQPLAGMSARNVPRG